MNVLNQKKDGLCFYKTRLFLIIFVIFIMNNNHTYNKKCDKWRIKITLTMKN